jgi:hypothetical protein
MNPSKSFVIISIIVALAFVAGVAKADPASHGKCNATLAKKAKAPAPAPTSRRSGKPITAVAALPAKKIFVPEAEKDAGVILRREATVTGHLVMRLVAYNQ